MIRKTVIISGGFGDIGKATAEKFAKNNYNIALTYNNNVDTLFIDYLKKYNIDVIAIKCNQAIESDVVNFINSTLQEFQTIDCFVACAGKTENPELLINKSEELIDDIINVNLKGTILFNKEICKFFMKQKRGNIINISSIYGISGGSLESVYSACKAGIIGLTKSLAIECAPYIRVNAIAPGCIDTKMINNLSNDDKQYIVNETPLERLGKPEDVANLIYFLASDESSYITGEVIQISGGIIRY